VYATLKSFLIAGLLEACILVADLLGVPGVERELSYERLRIIEDSEALLMFFGLLIA
jgi:hypothetical protein